MKRMMARQNGAKKRSLHLVNEHFKPIFDAASSDLGINQSFLKIICWTFLTQGCWAFRLVWRALCNNLAGRVSFYAPERLNKTVTITWDLWDPSSAKRVVDVKSQCDRAVEPASWVNQHRFVSTQPVIK